MCRNVCGVSTASNLFIKFAIWNKIDIAINNVYWIHKNFDLWKKLRKHIERVTKV